MKRRDFLKFGSAGIAGVALGGLTRLPLVKIGNVFAAAPGAWNFGVMGDTQWTQHTTDPTNSAFTDYSIDPAGDNPYSVAVSIINQIDAQFVQQGVKFVIQAGDLTTVARTAPWRRALPPPRPIFIQQHRLLPDARQPRDLRRRVWPA